MRLGLFSLIILVICSSCSSAPRAPEGSSKAQLWLELGNASLAEGDAVGALENFGKSEEEDPAQPELHHSKGLAYFARKDLNRAVASVRRALQLKKDFPAAQNTLGRFLFEQGKYEEAIEVLEVASKNILYPELYKPLTQLGVIYYQRSQLSQAENYFDKAIEDAPAAACIAYYYRGHIRVREGKKEEGVRDYERASKQSCAQFAEPRLAIGIVYQKNKQFDLARKYFLEVQNRYPGTKVAESAMKHLRYLP